MKERWDAFDGDDGGGEAPIDPVAFRARTIEALALALEAAPPATRVDQLVQAIIELDQLRWLSRNLTEQLPPQLALRARLMTEGLDRTRGEAFGDLAI